MESPQEGPRVSDRGQLLHMQKSGPHPDVPQHCAWGRAEEPTSHLAPG